MRTVGHGHGHSSYYQQNSRTILVHLIKFWLRSHWKLSWTRAPLQFHEHSRGGCLTVLPLNWSHFSTYDLIIGEKRRKKCVSNWDWRLNKELNREFIESHYENLWILKLLCMIWRFSLLNIRNFPQFKCHFSLVCRPCNRLHSHLHCHNERKPLN